MRVWPRRRIRLLRAVSVVLALAGLALAPSSSAPWLVAAGGAVCAFGLYLFASRRYRRRRRLVEAPFPEKWARILRSRVAYYQRLDDEHRKRFEDDVRIFLDEQRIYGARGHDVDDDARLLIAASAAMMSHGLPDWEWPNVRDIVVHPTAFDEDYQGGLHGEISGMVHQQGPILYSDRDLRIGFRRADGSNVGIHELAHVMDLADGYADGIPVGAGWVADAPWMEIIHDRLAAMRRRKYDSLRSYAGTNEAEFFAVAVEAFFERPERLREHDPQLYELLSDYFKQDPADGVD